MAKIRFFPHAGPATLADIAGWIGAELPQGADGAKLVTDIAPLPRAGPNDLSLLCDCDDPAELRATRAAAVIAAASWPEDAPASCTILATSGPERAMATVLSRLFPNSTRPSSTFGQEGVSARAHVHPSAALEIGVIVDPGATIGPGARIGARALIGANAVIGPGVCVGRDASIGPGASVLCALLGDRVVVQAGARVGGDGSAFIRGPRGNARVPRAGRVILQDDVEVGANTTIDRGAFGDTIVGEGSRIDSLVQIGADAAIGRHCVIGGLERVASATRLEDSSRVGRHFGAAEPPRS